MGYLRDDEVASVPTGTRLTLQERKFIEAYARKQGHSSVSRVLRDLIRREMERAQNPTQPNAK